MLNAPSRVGVSAEPKRTSVEYWALPSITQVSRSVRLSTQIARPVRHRSSSPAWAVGGLVLGGVVVGGLVIGGLLVAVPAGLLVPGLADVGVALVGAPVVGAAKVGAVLSGAGVTGADEEEAGNGDCAPAFAVESLDEPELQADRARIAVTVTARDIRVFFIEWCLSRPKPKCECSPSRAPM
jgi:hypothetical protein